MSETLRRIVLGNRNGHITSIPSVCSAHPDVLRASLRLAEELDREIVVESTSNQVNQDGGYTGMRPSDFKDLVYASANAAGADANRIVLGGDHLGPQAWRKQGAEFAMAKAREMVAEYVQAGFGKIHLDCSAGCGDEPEQLADDVTAARSAELAAICLENSAAGEMSFVIGTEVPPPGGALLNEDGEIVATTPQSARTTLEAHELAFKAHGIEAAMPLVQGLVVQPGLEFSPMQVHHLPLDRDPHFKDVAMSWPCLCLEAHSTDYQNPEVFPRLAQLGFAFQKVGPALTFAWREAIYSLDMLRYLAGWGEPVVFPAMEKIMVADSGYWKGHYRGTEEELHIQRHFSYADRIRYYWPQEGAQNAVQFLIDDLQTRHAPTPMLAQLFSEEIIERADRIPAPWPIAIVEAKVQSALAPYFF